MMTHLVCTRWTSSTHWHDRSSFGRSGRSGRRVVRGSVPFSSVRTKQPKVGALKKWTENREKRLWKQVDWMKTEGDNGRAASGMLASPRRCLADGRLFAQDKSGMNSDESREEGARQSLTLWPSIGRSIKQKSPVSEPTGDERGRCARIRWWWWRRKIAIRALSLKWWYDNRAKVTPDWCPWCIRVVAIRNNYDHHRRLGTIKADAVFVSASRKMYYENETSKISYSLGINANTLSVLLNHIRKIWLCSLLWLSQTFKQKLIQFLIKL